MAGWFYNNEHITWNKETVGWVMVELAQVLEDEISGTVPASKVSSFITLKLISSASIPAAPANLTDSPSRQEQPKFNSQTFLYTISCPGLILAMAAIPVILNL